MPYFDHNATTPLCPPAREAWLRVQDRLWHNASSLYREAAAARDELERCRERLAELTGTESPERIVFTGGATEGCNGFFRGCADASSAPPDAGSVRSGHFAVRTPGGARTGPTVSARRKHLDPWRWTASGEAGTRRASPAFSKESDRRDRPRLNRWSSPGWRPTMKQAKFSLGRSGVHRMCPGASRGALHFCDASQWLGKLPASVFGGDGPHLVGCAHKFGGPKGVGFVRLGGDVEMGGDRPWQFGGPQEQGLRAGTEDVAGVAAMVAALEWCEDQMPGDPAPRDEFEHDLGWPVVAGDRPRLWNTSMVVAPRHSNKLWLARLSQRGFQCSTGSACSSGQDGDSHVLAAMGLTRTPCAASSASPPVGPLPRRLARPVRCPRRSSEGIGWGRGSAR